MNPRARVEIQGRASPLGTEAANRLLSQHRADNVAQAIRDYLGDQLGARFDRIEGLGEPADPIDPQSDDPKYRYVTVRVSGRVVLELAGP